MNRFAILIFFTLLFQTSLSAQKYYPFETSNVVWNELKEYGYLKKTGDDCPLSKFIETYFISGDTTINDLKFYKIFIKVSDDSSYIGCFREENRKVYYQGVDYFGFDTDSVILLYDFNKQKNDTVYTGTWQRAIINGIDSILVGNSYRKRFQMNDGQSWIEGIGSNFGFLYPMTNIPTIYWRSELICYKHNDSLLYKSPNYSDCNTPGNEFAPIGAEWYYDEGFAFSGDVDYILFTSEKDTLIHGEICRMITKRHDLWCFNRPSIEYLFSRNDTVFFFDTVFNEFQILYDFNAEKSEAWNIYFKDEDNDLDTVRITVDSISTTQINCLELKTLHVTYNKMDEYWPETYPSVIIEKLGDMTYMFNWYPWSGFACDANWTRGLRCYSDHDIGLYSTGIADSCNYTYDWTGIENPFNPDSEFMIFPNPASDYVIIKISKYSEFNYDILNQNGIIIQSGKSNNSNLKIDLSDFYSGLYIIRIYNLEEVIGTGKVIKINDR
jgi:hypothetical protein